jgi:hypothetical protein
MNYYSIIFNNYIKILFLFNKKPYASIKDKKRVVNKSELTQTMKLNHKTIQC